MKFCKSLFVVIALTVVSACSTNPATGQKQFAALMSPQQEVNVGASEHQKVLKQYGLYQDADLQAYVERVGRKVTAQTERPEVQYKFFVIDSPIINAFALPGGYIYVSRGLVALANSEAELAAVLAHETGHITGRHSAERYSRGLVTSLGAAVISAAVDRSGVTQALGVGSNLYLSSYSRGQEAEADSLGLRYMTRGGYDASAMPSFLTSMYQESTLASDGKGEGFNYFSTHPATGQRVADTTAQLVSYKKGGIINRDEFLNVVNGIVYGDSPEHGYVRGHGFYHPGMGFKFNVPEGFKITNQPDKVVATSRSGAVILFDIVSSDGLSPSEFIARKWTKGDGSVVPEKTSVNGRNAATAGLEGSVNNVPMNIRLIAIDWNGKIARFQVAIPKNAGSALLEDLKRSTYSFDSITQSERNSIRPQRLKVVTAGAGETVSSLANRQPFNNENETRFRVLNGLKSGQGVVSGQRYKIVVD